MPKQTIGEHIKITRKKFMKQIKKIKKTKATVSDVHSGSHEEILHL
jgi:SpoVK/Ycf46/Vps4 family AAA+-type ATPase